MAKPFKDLNRRPTKEELEKGMADNLKKLEEIEEAEKKKAEELANGGEDQDEDEEQEDENQDEPKGDDEDKGDEDDSDGDEDDQDEDDEEEDEPNPPAKVEPKPKKEAKEGEPDYKKRYSDSSSEAHILYSKNKKMADAISKAGEVAEPTEDELKTEYSDWEDMTDTEKRMAKRSLHDSKKLQAITESAKEFKDIDEWNGKVDKFLADPETIVEHPKLDGKEEDFKIFVTTKQSRMGADFEDLVASFLYAESQKVKPKNRGSMFEHSSGGKNGKITPKNDKISIADSKILMKANYKKYLEMLKAGKIEEESLD